MTILLWDCGKCVMQHKMSDILKCQIGKKFVQNVTVVSTKETKITKQLKPTQRKSDPLKFLLGHDKRQDSNGINFGRKTSLPKMRQEK